MNHRRIIVTSSLSLVLLGRAASASAPPGRYTVSSGTVYDMRTKLTWQQATAPGTYTRPNAVSYCAGLSLQGSSWRLPTFKELLTILDVTVTTPHAIDDTAFPQSQSDNYWSATPVAGSPGDSWVVPFYYSLTYNYPNSSTYYVRCVR